MGTYTLRVANADDQDAPVDPLVGERVLAAADALFREICRNIVSGELRLQGEVPEALYADAGIFDDRDLSADARRMMDGTLDYLGGGTHGTWMDDTFPDVVGRKRVAARVLDVASALDGCLLIHGVEGEEGVFSGVDTVWVRGMANAVVRATNGGLMGLVVKDPSRRDHWALMRDEGLVPLIFKPGTSRYDIEDYAAAGPVSVTGTVPRRRVPTRYRCRQGSRARIGAGGSAFVLSAREEMVPEEPGPGDRGGGGHVGLVRHGLPPQIPGPVALPFRRYGGGQREDTRDAGRHASVPPGF